MNPSQRTRAGHRPELPGHRASFGTGEKLRLDCGVELGPFSIGWQTYGRLNEDRSNAILVCHTLTGDQFVAETHPLTGKPGWWQSMVGDGLPLDTSRFFIICSNVLGGCMGTSGPRDIDPLTGRPYGLTFPVITVAEASTMPIWNAAEATS